MKLCDWAQGSFPSLQPMGLENEGRVGGGEGMVGGIFPLSFHAW